MIRKGFTLIELLVVISIIALLMSIMMPSLNRAREAAKAVVCAKNMQSMGLGCMLYAEDNSGYLPPSSYGFSESDRRRTWMTYISGYMNVDLYVGSSVSKHHAKTVFYCPSDRTEWQDATYSGLTQFSCTKNSYSANLAIMDEVVQDSDADGHLGPRRVSGISNASRTIMLMEGAHHKWNMVGRSDGNAWHGELSRGPIPYNLWLPNELGYHNERSNWAFADGHAEKLEYLKTINMWDVD